MQEYNSIFFDCLHENSVSSLPTTHHTDFWGAKALTSLTGHGVYLQSYKYFYELSCDTNSCHWQIMEHQLTQSVQYSSMMYLPPGFARENCLSDGCPTG